ncbi:hypothetical protein [Roseomonas sp. KE0001]|uniref:hypothetical protein n=1 Tax=Roseomonas sp. KE0001 TaxID=2479201 RepID=UPI0018DF32B8|nr:hypothetical protein [Roseomonas sp. KE0001]MBI0432447.1 hypothetical protein [Roseomonas sp. KE0001]
MGRRVEAVHGPGETGGGAAGDRGAPAPLDAASEAAVAAHVAVLRRQYALLAQAGRGGPVVRGPEMLWCFLEAALAQSRGERLTHKDLQAYCAGALSPATLSRALADAVARGYLLQSPAPEDSRVKLITPSEGGMRFLAEQAPAAVEELRQILSPARR